MSFNRLCVCVLLMASCFAACKKNNLPGNAGKRLAKIVSGDADSISCTTFHYDADNKVIGYTDTDNHNISYRWETSLHYNAQGDPVASRTVRTIGLLKDTLVYGDSLVYQKNRIVKKMHYNYFSHPYASSNTYAYNAQGNLTVDSSFVHTTQDSDQLSSYSNFTYDANDNIVQWESFPKPLYSPVTPITATYSNTPNVFKALGNWLYFLGPVWQAPPPALLSKYNVLKVDYGIYYGTNSIQSYSYEYDQDGFITKIIVTLHYYGGEYMLTTTFYYE